MATKSSRNRRSGAGPAGAGEVPVGEGAATSKPTDQRRFSATPMMLLYLGDLVDTGLFGSKESEVAGRLIAMSIETLIRDGTIQRRPLKKVVPDTPTDQNTTAQPKTA